MNRSPQPESFSPFPSLTRIRREGGEEDRYIRLSLERIRAMDRGPDGIHAFLSVAGDGAEAGELGATNGPPGGRTPAVAPPPGGTRRVLAGVPVGVKDNLATLDLPTSCGSRMLDGYISPYEATVIRRLRAAGAAVVGKTNLDEFAMGSSTENSAFGPTRNPVDPGRVPGGSSGGSAAAVAAGMVPVALGSDTGGSVRQPAAFCGVVGIKPTYGRVSRYGLVAFASSLDQVGSLGRTVADAALLLEVVAGHDPRDATSAHRPVPALAEAARLEGKAGEATRPLEGLVVGVPREYFPDTLGSGVESACRDALGTLESLGAGLRPVSLEYTEAAVPTYYVLAPAEASSNLARYDGVRFGFRAPGARSGPEVYEVTRSAGFGREVLRRIMLGTFVLSAGYYDEYYGRAQRVRRLIAGELLGLYDDGVDILFTPTSPTTAFRHGERTADPYAMYLADVFTVTANLAGIPALSLPVGWAEGLPVGGQLMAPPWREERMIRVAALLERALRDTLPPGDGASTGGSARGDRASPEPEGS